VNQHKRLREAATIDDQSTAPLQAVEKAVLFPAVSEVSGSFRERQRFGKEFRIKRLGRSAKRLNGLNVLNTRLASFHPTVSRRDQGSMSFSAKITKP
jgi:hypothetical protein